MAQQDQETMMQQIDRPRPGRPFPRSMLALGLALVLAGCVSPRHAQQQADRAAYQIIREKQASALGKTEPFTLHPEDELRRRLLLDQQLPAGGYASFGRDYLPPVSKQPGGVSPGLELPEEAVVVGGPTPHVRGVHTETFAADAFLLGIGRNPESGAVPIPPLPWIDAEPAPSATAWEPPPPIVLSLVDALQVAARNSRDYQRQKEQVFLAALNLDLERDRFEFRFSGAIDATIATEFEGEETAGVVLTPALGINKLFKQGTLITTRIGIDLSRLLTGDRSSALGTFADATITIPLLRGAGVEVVTENLHQAERDAIYSIWDFETFKRNFAVLIVSDYLSVLGDLNNVQNSQANYQRLQESAERASSMFDEGRLPGIQVDQAIQQALRARERLLLARQRYEARLDNFKLRLGLPPDARIELDSAELERLTPLADRVLGPDRDGLGDRDPGDAQQIPPQEPEPEPPQEPLEEPAAQQIPPQEPEPQPESAPQPGDPTRLPAGVSGELPQPDLADSGAAAQLQARALRTALRNRLDLAATYGEVIDAQRRTVVAADALQADLDLSGSAGWGGRRGAFAGGQENATIRFDEGRYSAGIGLDLPIERTAERNAYRVSLINLDRAIRNAQELEDRVKLDVLTSIRSLRVAAEDLRIQSVAIQVAQRRVEAANLLIDLGRGEIRDLTEAEEALVTAQNSFTASLVDYRVAQLQLQRDLGVLEVDADGLFEETELFELAP